MATKREQILAAVATTLAGTTGVSTRIYRSRQEAFARNEAPAIVIEPGNDTAAPEPVSTCKIDWTFTLVVAVYARGTIPDQSADATIQSLHSKLLADRSLGGLAMDIWPQAVDPQFDKGDLAAAWIVCTYTVRYRTGVTDLSS
jgi:hypothetical protein